MISICPTLEIATGKANSFIQIVVGIIHIVMLSIVMLSTTLFSVFNFYLESVQTTFYLLTSPQPFTAYEVLHLLRTSSDCAFICILSYSHAV